MIRIEPSENFVFQTIERASSLAKFANDVVDVRNERGARYCAPQRQPTRSFLTAANAAVGIRRAHGWVLII